MKYYPPILLSFAALTTLNAATTLVPDDLIDPDGLVLRSLPAAFGTSPSADASVDLLSGNGYAVGFTGSVNSCL